MTFLILVALATAFQEPDVEALLKQLSDEAIEVRDKAAAALIELGDKAEEKVKALAASADPELKSRLVAVLRDIGKARKLRAVLPPTRRVTVDVKDAPVRDVLARLAKEAGLEFSGVPDRGARVTLSLKDAHPFEALDAACKAANLDFLEGMSRSGFGRPRDTQGKAIALNPGYKDLPRAFAGPFVISVGPIRIPREPRPSDTHSFALYWSPDCRPQRLPGMRITSAFDDKGTDLLPDVGLDGCRDTVLGELHQTMALRLKSPAADATKISLKGRGMVLFSLGQTILAFKKPAECEGQERASEQFTIRLEKCILGTDVARFRIQVRQLEGKTPPRGIFADHFSNRNIRLVTEDGASQLNVSYTASGLVKGGATVDLVFEHLKSPVASLEFLFDTQVHCEAFAFEFKDIPLTK